MYDLVGGGFHRYSVDERWLVPHFEKMLYDNAQLAVAYLHGWLVLGERALPGGRRGDDRLSCCASSLLDGGGFASAQDADTDGVEGLTFTWTPRRRRAGGAARAVRGRAASSCAASSIPRRGRGCSRSASSGRSRCATTRRSPPGTGSRSRRSPSAAGSSTGRTGSTRRAGWPSSCSGRSRRAEGRLHRTWRDGIAKGTGLPRGLRRRGERPLRAARRPPASCAGSRRRTGSRGLPSSSSATTSTAASSRRPSTESSSSRARRSFDDHPSPSGNSMLAYVLLRLARIYGDEALEERAVVGLPAGRDGARAGAERLRLDARRARPATSRRRGSSRSSAPPDSAVARAALARWEPRAVVAFGPAEDVPLLEGKTLVGGLAGRLRLRAVRLPRAGHRPGRARGAARGRLRALARSRRSPRPGPCRAEAGLRSNGRAGTCSRVTRRAARSSP